MPAIIIEVIQALMAAIPQIPSLVSAAEDAIGIAQTGSVTPEQEAAIRAKLDAVKQQIDNA